jgi:flagellar protein FlgJ
MPWPLRASSPSFYADFQGLERLRASAGRQDPAALREAARQFEGLFTAMMLKSMREASLGGGLGDSQETQTYQDMYDQQIALQMAHGKGLGLADMLMQQLTRSSAAHAAAIGSTAGAAQRAALPAPAGGAPGDRGGESSGSRQAGEKISSAQRADFVRSLEPLAQTAGSSLGVAPDTLIAQAALETGWGQQASGGRRAATAAPTCSGSRRAAPGAEHRCSRAPLNTTRARRPGRRRHSGVMTMRRRASVIMSRC